MTASAEVTVVCVFFCLPVLDGGEISVQLSHIVLCEHFKQICAIHSGNCHSEHTTASNRAGTINSIIAVISDNNFSNSLHYQD